VSSWHRPLLLLAVIAIGGFNPVAQSVVGAKDRCRSSLHHQTNLGGTAAGCVFDR
jgi:hypothetical protein